MTEPVSGAHPSGAQPGAADAGWAPQQAAPATPEKKGLKKVLPIVGSVAGAAVVLGIGGAVFGFGDPEVGDCVQMQGETDFEQVDCDSADAQYRIVGVDDKKQGYEAFQDDPEVCTGFADAEAARWIEDAVGAEGTTYCAVPTA